LTKGGHLLAFCPLEEIGAYKLVCKAAKLDYRQALVWIKTNPAPVHREAYASAVEAIIWAVKPGGRPYRDPQAAKAGAESLNVFWGPGVPGSAKDRIHPTQKPEWLIRKLLKLHANADLGHRVIDPFAGGATTGVVCRQEGFACTMIERDEDIVRKAKIRLEAMR
jgi:DNA modification methylase